MKKVLLITAAVAVAAAAVMLYAFNPEGSAWAPKCLLRTMTGFDCPGCGSGRALHNLLHLRIAKGLAYNPILALAIPYVALLLWLEYLGGGRRFPRLRLALTGRTAIVVVSAIIILWWIGRNL